MEKEFIAVCFGTLAIITIVVCMLDFIRALFNPRKITKRKRIKGTHLYVQYFRNYGDVVGRIYKSQTTYRFIHSEVVTEKCKAGNTNYDTITNYVLGKYQLKKAKAVARMSVPKRLDKSNQKFKHNVPD